MNINTSNHQRHKPELGQRRMPTCLMSWQTSVNSCPPRLGTPLDSPYISHILLLISNRLLDSIVLLAWIKELSKLRMLVLVS